MASEPRTYRLVRFSDLLELDDRQFEAVIDGLPDVLRTARATRKTLRATAELFGLPDPCPDASACLPHIDWIDDGERVIRMNITTHADRSEGDE